MLTPEESRQALTRYFHRRRIAGLEVLFELLDTRSRMSVFRRLCELGYHSSYSHAGRYYTLIGIPQFDADGLWQFEGVHFSVYGSLKMTVRHLVDVADAGQTHLELQLRLGVRVHNALLELVQDRHIGRELLGGQYLYVNTDLKIASAQIGARKERERNNILEPEKVACSMVIEVLLEIIQGARIRPDAEVIAARLAARGISATSSSVRAILEEHGVKKTVGSHSARSR